MNDLPPWPNKYEPHDYAHMHDLIDALRARNARLVEALQEAADTLAVNVPDPEADGYRLALIEACKEPT